MTFEVFCSIFEELGQYGKMSTALIDKNHSTHSFFSNDNFQISMWRAVKMMQSVVSGFHDVSSNRIRTFFNQLKSNCETSGSNRYINHASLMQVTPRNFVFDRNYILADQIDEPDLNCWVKFILNPKQLNSKR